MESNDSESKNQVTEFEAIEKIASTYSMPPDEVIWKYTKKQIEEIYIQIQKRETEEINLEYKMIRATRTQNPPENFLETGKSKKISNDAQDTGVGSDEELKNHNPNLKIRR